MGVRTIFSILLAVKDAVLDQHGIAVSYSTCKAGVVIIRAVFNGPVKGAADELKLAEPAPGPCVTGESAAVFRRHIADDINADPYIFDGGISTHVVADETAATSVGPCLIDRAGDVEILNSTIPGEIKRP